MQRACLAINPTSTLIQRMCASFVAMVANMTGEQVTIWIGSTPIARGKDAA
jgi:hypothetical protein